MICQNCSQDTDAKSSFCKHCGAAHRVCQNCQKGIDADSKFCIHCGAVNSLIGDADIATIKVASTDVGADLKASSLGKKKDIKKLLVIIMILLGVLYVNKDSLFVQGIIAQYFPWSLSRNAFAPFGSEYSVKRRILEADAKKAALHILKKDFPYPTSALLDLHIFEHDGVILMLSGTVEYEYVNQFNSNKKTKEVKPFVINMVMSTDQAYHVLFLEVGDEVKKDVRSSVDREGIIIAQSITFGDRGYGNRVFDNIVNPDAWINNEADYISAKNQITLAEYNSIKMGMSYEDVCKIIGSSGTVMSRSNIAGYETFIVAWEGMGDLGANANVTFQNNKAIATAQIGLK